MEMFCFGILAGAICTMLLIMTIKVLDNDTDDKGTHD